MQITCPCCSARYPLDAALQEDAGRELQMLLARAEPGLALPLVGYLGLFRSKSRALGWERAVRLAQETLELCEDRQALATALSETIQSLRDKQQQPNWKPLGGHNYLKRVLEAVLARRGTEAPRAPTTQAAQTPRTEAGKALAALEDRIRDRD